MNMVGGGAKPVEVNFTFRTKISDPAPALVNPKDIWGFSTYEKSAYNARNTLMYEPGKFIKVEYGRMVYLEYDHTVNNMNIVKTVDFDQAIASKGYMITPFAVTSEGVMIGIGRSKDYNVNKPDFTRIAYVKDDGVVNIHKVDPNNVGVYCLGYVDGYMFIKKTDSHVYRVKYDIVNHTYSEEEDTNITPRGDMTVGIVMNTNFITCMYNNAQGQGSYSISKAIRNSKGQWVFTHLYSGSDSWNAITNGYQVGVTIGDYHLGCITHRYPSGFLYSSKMTPDGSAGILYGTGTLTYNGGKLTFNQKTDTGTTEKIDIVEGSSSAIPSLLYAGYSAAPLKTGWINQGTIYLI